ncbi:phosphatase PAP2 family protein [Rummeliibacillus sp. JY-2-4R]
MKRFYYPFAIVTVIIFWIIYFNLNSNWIASLDANASDLLKGSSFFGFFHNFGETKFILLVAILMLIWLWIRHHNYSGMMFVLLAIGAGNVLNQMIKNWVQRTRPDIPHQLSSFSFPSGHAMVGILYIFTLAYFITEFSASTKKKIIVWSFAVILTALIGLSRIAESHHFASDIIAGWSLGYSWFILIVIWYERRKKVINQHTN